MVVDGLSISNKIFEQERMIANLDLKYMITYLTKMFNWKYDEANDSFHSKTTLNSTEIKNVKDTIKEIKEANTAKVEAIYEQIVKEGFDVNSDVLDSLKKSSTSDSKEVEIRSLVNYVYNHYDVNDIKDVVDVLSVYKTKQSKSLIYNNTNIRKIKESTDYDPNNQVQKFVRDVYNSFTLNKFYTSVEMQFIFVECLKSNGLYNEVKHNSKNKITSLMKSFFAIEKKQQRIGDNKINGYELMSTDLLPYTLRTIDKELYTKGIVNSILLGWEE